MVVSVDLHIIVCEIACPDRVVAVARAKIKIHLPFAVLQDFHKIRFRRACIDTAADDWNAVVEQIRFGGIE